jgi:hypothetical protein
MTHMNDMGDGLFMQLILGIAQVIMTLLLLFKLKQMGRLQQLLLTIYFIIAILTLLLLRLSYIYKLFSMWMLITLPMSVACYHLLLTYIVSKEYNHHK